MKWFLPKQVDFLGYFERAADNLLAGAEAFNDLVTDYRNVEEKVGAIKVFERQGDHITHDTLDALNRTFITPIDREDIYQLISRMDDVLDLIDAAAHRLAGYRIEKPTPQLVAIAAQLIKPIETIKQALLLLDNMRHQRRILDLCVEVNRLENDADALHHQAIADLFDHEKDPIRLLKMKEIYENLEEATDRCEDIANIIEGIIIKYS